MFGNGAIQDDGKSNAQNEASIGPDPVLGWKKTVSSLYCKELCRLSVIHMPADGTVERTEQVMYRFVDAANTQPARPR